MKRRPCEVGDPAVCNLEMAREHLADVHSLLNVVVIHLLLVGRAFASERAAGSIATSRRAIEVGRAHLAGARAELDAVIKAEVAADDEAESVAVTL